MRMSDSLKINHAPLIKHVMLEFCLPQLMLSKIELLIYFIPSCILLTYVILYEEETVLGLNRIKIVQ